MHLWLERHRRDTCHRILPAQIRGEHRMRACPAALESPLPSSPTESSLYILRGNCRGFLERYFGNVTAFLQFSCPRFHTTDGSHLALLVQSLPNSGFLTVPLLAQLLMEGFLSSPHVFIYFSPCGHVGDSYTQWDMTHLLQDSFRLSKCLFWPEAPLADLAMLGALYFLQAQKSVLSSLRPPAPAQYQPFR